MKTSILLLIFILAGCNGIRPQPSICDNFIGFEGAICSLNEQYLAGIKTINLAYQSGDITRERHQELVDKLIAVDQQIDKAEMLFSSGSDPAGYFLVAQDMLRDLLREIANE